MTNSEIKKQLLRSWRKEFDNDREFNNELPENQRDIYTDRKQKNTVCLKCFKYCSSKIECWEGKTKGFSYPDGKWLRALLHGVSRCCACPVTFISVLAEDMVRNNKKPFKKYPKDIMEGLIEAQKKVVKHMKDSGEKRVK